MVARVVNARCPGVLHGLAARDGLLVRIRIPGGMLAPAQFAAIADASRAYGDGNVDITAHANVQLRGLRAHATVDLGDALERASLLPSRSHDRVRNIAASPFCGVDPGELFDVRPLVRELDARIVADARLAALPAKFGFAIDGGARAFEPCGADLCARAVNTPAGVRFHLRVAGVDSGAGATPGNVVGVLVDAALRALDVARAEGAPQTWRLTTLPAAQRAVLTQSVRELESCPIPSRTATHAIPYGTNPARGIDRINVIASVPLGRLSFAQAHALAAIAQEHGGEVRLAWWRAVVIASVPREALAQIAGRLDALDLPCDRQDGYNGLAACSGIHGCTSAKADVRADAAEIARRLSGSAVPQQWSVNLAGCERRCGMRSNACIELVASSNNGYDVTLNGTAFLRGASRTNAIDTVLAVHAGAPL